MKNQFEWRDNQNRVEMSFLDCTKGGEKGNGVNFSQNVGYGKCPWRTCNHDRSSEIIRLNSINIRSKIWWPSLSSKNILRLIIQKFHYIFICPKSFIKNFHNGETSPPKCLFLVQISSWHCKIMWYEIGADIRKAFRTCSTICGRTFLRNNFRKKKQLHHRCLTASQILLWIRKQW